MIRRQRALGGSAAALLVLIACGSGATNSAGSTGSRGEVAIGEHCSDKSKNEDETDVDCGGSTCDKCADDMGCNVPADCTSGSCDARTKKCGSLNNPTFTSITPGTGTTAGGTRVTISGTNFAPSGAVNVRINGVAATGVTSTATSITCSTGANLGNAGLGDVVITNPTGGTATGRDKFRYYFGNVSLAPALVFPSTGPMNPRAADLNGDGQIDLFWSILGSPDVGVRLGKGDGTFGSVRRFGGGGESGGVSGFYASVEAADLNGDNKLDLLVTFQEGTLHFLAGNGDGTFQPGVAFGTGTFNFFSAIGDVDGDRKLDVVVSGTGAEGARVFIGKGDGTFMNGLQTVVGPKGFRPTLVDINGDNKLDLVVARAFAGVETDVGIGNGNGTFQAPVTVKHPGGGGSQYAGAADLNADGKLDLVMGSDTGGLAVSLGNGDGTFATATLVLGGFGCMDAYAVDVDKDGVLDLVAGESGNAGIIRYFRGNGDGTFAPALPLLVTDTSDLRGLGLTDFDKDGRLDVFSAAPRSNLVFTSLGSSK